MQTKQQKLKQFNIEIEERRAYLLSIEKQISDISESANNRLFELNGEIEQAEKQLATVMRRKYEIEQYIRENQHVA